MRKTPTVFAFMSLALILASCGGTNTPGTPGVTTPGATAPLVKVDVAALGGLRAQGLTGDAGPLFFNVNVRDSQNQLVAFNGTTFDPTGTGTKTLTLNLSNAFRQTLLLPAGTYSFETAAKDGATGSTLLAYGPAAENTATIQGDGAVVRLTFHAVFHKASSSLDFSTNTPLLFTNSTFNLKLSPKIAPVTGLSATVPTTDIGNVTYTLGNATDAVLNNAGSKIGINLTARGTAEDSTLNVTASFNAWTQVDGTDTAVYGPTTLDFSKAIETNALVADTVMPTLVSNTVSNAAVGASSALSGTATDDVMLSEIRVYDDNALVASNVASDNVTAITTNASGNWNTTWVPTTAGSHDLSVIVSDSSGNETRAEQTVSVAAAPLNNYDVLLDYANMGGYDYQYFTVPANGELWIKVNTNGWTGNTVNEIYSYDGHSITGTLGTSRADQRAFEYTYSNDVYDYNLTATNGSVYMHATNNNPFPINIVAVSQQY
ncbi:Ig-like domain-containing protein [Deinococcus sp. QL22]|uniref:Ig-like domain-containing protein n=1 Tax=Deinococcus sp. QL22 TaxID=2939437 RepID=UPI00201763B4|nr:Ig-like domain-containing protein [Deinococcus sp. QL22]UQN09387.1 Ig-like domain-containing protein [Deinococcus sp. QL22]